MPKVVANHLTLNYEQQGSGEPLILLPFLSADHACFAFQIPEYAKHFTCIALDLRGTGESDKPATAYTIEHVADDVAAFMQALGIQQAHFAGQSLGAAAALWLGAKYPKKALSLSIHGGWSKTHMFLQSIIEGWRLMAKALNSVPEMVVRGIFPWCFTPELYAARPDYIQTLAAFVRSRPAQAVEDFLRQTEAVLTHDIEGHLSSISAPTLITVGRKDRLTTPRDAVRLKEAIPGSEMLMFEDCAHAALFENVAEFNQKTLEFLRGSARARAA